MKRELVVFTLIVVGATVGVGILFKLYQAGYGRLIDWGFGALSGFIIGWIWATEHCEAEIRKQDKDKVK